ncbi:hypothetical protein P4L24_24860 [Bacillus cereus]|nr:hypothetical protein [Bacillus cereus]
MDNNTSDIVENKYVNLKHVQELIKLIKIRDTFWDWSNEYEKYNKKVQNTIEWIERNAKKIEKVE